jgi:FkbM family methyltransferase
MQEVIVENSVKETINISHNKIQLAFFVPNRLTRLRATTFSTKEPETLRWIDSFPDSSTVWDIGANVGIYTIYGAKKGHRVLAFEPSVFNLEFLVRNISLNSVGERVTVLPFPLSDDGQISEMLVRDSSWGGSLSRLSNPAGSDGKSMMHSELSFRTLSLTVDQAVKELGLPNPDFIKLDVDGVENLVLMGGLEVLNTIQSILVEVNHRSYEHVHQIRTLLESKGLIQKGYAEIEGDKTVFMQRDKRGRAVYNQIWERK